MFSLAIIPARSGSKRLPKKNIKLLAKKPLIAWTIEAAVNSGCFDKIIVSTDDETIAEISKKYGADVPFIRPKNLAEDGSKTMDVVFHAIDFLNKIKKNDSITLLQPTSPFRTASDIKNAFKFYRTNVDASGVVSVCKEEHSPLWANTLPPNLSMKGFIRPEVKNKTSQELPDYYRVNGAIYISAYDYMKQNMGFFGYSTFAYIMESEHSIDIDTELDFTIAEYLLEKKGSK